MEEMKKNISSAFLESDWFAYSIDHTVHWNNIVLFMSWHKGVSPENTQCLYHMLPNSVYGIIQV